MRTNLSAPDAEAPPSAHGRRAVELHDYKNRVIVSVTMDDGVRLSPRNSNSRRRGSAWRVPSVNSSASSNSSSTSTSPTGSGSYPAHSHSDHQASSQDGDSGGEVGGPDIGVPSDSGSQDDDGSENNLQSLITEEDAKEAIEKNLTVGMFPFLSFFTSLSPRHFHRILCFFPITNSCMRFSFRHSVLLLVSGSPTERIQYGLSMVAGSDGSIRELDDDILCLIIDAMEGVLGQSVENPKILSDLHPDKLMEAHYVLANYHHERIRNHWMTAHADTALRHCREALLLMHGRERLNAQKAATLNVWASNVLLIDRNPGRIQKNIPLALKHLHAARVAMYAYTETNQKLSFDICLLIAEAHSQKADEPVCASLLQAYKAYCDAEDMLRMSEFDDGLHWMRLGCHQLQLMLRFLSHKRKAQVRKRPLCYQAEMVSCRKGFDSTDGVNDITPDATIARAEALRHRILRHLAVHPNEETGSAEPRDVVCTTHETVARAYLERAAIGEGQGIEDIRKAGQNVEKAISACERDNDFTGQRYSALRELADDIQDALHDVESFSDIQVAPKPATSEASEEYSLSVEIEE